MNSLPVALIVLMATIAIEVVATTPSASAQADVGAARDYYLAEVDTGVQAQCLVCHKAGGVAPQAGARLVLGPDEGGITTLF